MFLGFTREVCLRLYIEENSGLPSGRDDCVARFRFISRRLLAHSADDLKAVRTSRRTLHELYEDSNPSSA